MRGIGIVLTGTNTELEYREDLIKSTKSLFNSREDEPLLNVIKETYPDFKVAHVIDGTPEPDMNLFKVLIDDCMVAVIELEHDQEKKPKVTTLTVPQYLRKLSKQKRIKLAVAIDLAKQNSIY